MANSITVDRAEEVKETYSTSVGLQKKDQPAIHTMPKKFLHVRAQSGGQVKGVGLIILIVGAIVLIAGLAGAYYFFTDTSDESGKISAPDTVEKEPVNVDPPSLDNDSPVITKPPVVPKVTQPSIVTPPKPIQPQIATQTVQINDATSTKPIVPVKPDKPAVYQSALDSDKDGLTDAEELIFNSDLNKPDSDNDGYTDASELGNLYNPVGTGKIIVNPNIKKYSNPTHKYALYYPSIWAVSQVGSHDSIMFDLGNDQKIQVIALSDTAPRSLDDWYMETFGIEEIKPEQRMYKMGWSALRSEDGLTVYLMHPESDIIFSLTYNLALEDVLHFKSVFMMMVNSMELE